MKRETIVINKEQLLRIIRTTYKSGEIGQDLQWIIKIYSTLFDDEPTRKKRGPTVRWDVNYEKLGRNPDGSKKQ